MGWHIIYGIYLLRAVQYTYYTDKSTTTCPHSWAMEFYFNKASLKILQEVFVQSNNSFCATTIDDSRKNYKIIVAFDFDMWGPSRWQVGAMR